jgi:uncharacterized membrane protein
MTKIKRWRYKKEMIIILISFILFLIFMFLIISIGENTKRMETCANSNKTYITFTEGMIKGTFCGDILELKDLTDSFKGVNK